MTISTVTASLSSPGRSEHASFESTSGSIGSTAPGTYTLVPRLTASRSSRPPGRTYAVTSAMWTQTRTRSPSRRAEIASSKSRASSGSIVNVGRSRRSTRVSAAYGSCSRASASAVAARE